MFTIFLQMILLTGDNGFLGKYIKEEFIYNSFLFQTLNRSHADYKLDLSSEVPFFRSYFDIVIHCAGAAHIVPKTNLQFDLIYNTNIKCTENLLLGLKNIGIPKRFVFISSVSVYGRSNGILIKECDELLASDAYGKSKIICERIITDWCKKNNVTCTILRLPLIVGSNPPGNLGDMINAIKNNYYFNLRHINPRKSMVLAKNVASIIFKASEFGGIYNLTDGYHPTFVELSNYIANQLNKGKVLTLPYIFVKLVAIIGDTILPILPINSKKLRKMSNDLTFDDTKARNTFNWCPVNVIDGFTI
jgi:nucleoside-diphosphate-sugar epimerase